MTMNAMADGQKTAVDRSTAQSRSELIQFGPIPVLQHFFRDSEELNAKLRQVIVARMERSHGVIDTNVGGWHSERDLASWDDPPIGELLARVRSLVPELVAATVTEPVAEHLDGWKIEGWANVNRRGAFNKSHHHWGGGSRNLWSGIYYVHQDPGSDVVADGGLTRFEDRSGVPKEILRCRDPFERELTIVPRPGLMVFFPATLRHYVTPYEAVGDRITIALNLKNEGFVIPRYPDGDAPSFLWRNLRGPMLVADRLKRMVLRRRTDY